MRWLIGALVAGGLAWLAFPLLVSVTLEVVLAEDSNRIEIRWARGDGFEADHASFASPIAGAHLQTPIPPDTRSIRIDLRRGPGRSRIESVTIAGLTTLARWDSQNRFAGWVSQPHAATVRPGDTLEVTSRAPTPFILNRTIQRAIQSRRGIERGGAALLAAILGSVLGAWLLRRRPALARKLGLATVALALFGGLALLIYPLIRPAPTGGYFDRGGVYTFSFVDDGGRRLSSQDGQFRMILDPWTLYRNAPGQKTEYFTIDEYGFRDGIPDGDQPLAAVLGASTAVGHGLAPGAPTFARLLQQKLDRRFVNGAVSGFLSGQELSMMIHRVDRLRPSLYIVFDGWNDLCEMVPRDRLEAVGNAFYAFAERLRDHHLLLGGDPSEPPSELTWPPRSEGDPVFRCARVYATNLEKMHAWSKQRGAEFIVAFQPLIDHKTRSPEEAKIAFERKRTEHYDRFLRLTKKWCDAAGVPWIDVGADPRFRAAEETLFLDPVHLNAAGHALVAEILADRLSGKR